MVTSLTAEDVRTHLHEVGWRDELTDGDLASTLDQLVGWNLLDVGQNHTERYRTARDYERRNLQYAMTRAGEAALAGHAADGRDAVGDRCSAERRAGRDRGEARRTGGPEQRHGRRHRRDRPADLRPAAGAGRPPRCAGRQRQAVQRRPATATASGERRRDDVRPGQAVDRDVPAGVHLPARRACCARPPGARSGTRGRRRGTRRPRLRRCRAAAAPAHAGARAPVDRSRRGAMGGPGRVVRPDRRDGSADPGPERDGSTGDRRAAAGHRAAAGREAAAVQRRGGLPPAGPVVRGGTRRGGDAPALARRVRAELRPARAPRPPGSGDRARGLPVGGRRARARLAHPAGVGPDGGLLAHGPRTRCGGDSSGARRAGARRARGRGARAGVALHGRDGFGSPRSSSSRCSHSASCST